MTKPMAPGSELARLRAMLESQPVIEQAKGIIMATYRCGPDEAFGMLRRASQSSGSKIDALAAKLVAKASRE